MPETTNPTPQATAPQQSQQPSTPQAPASGQQPTAPQQGQGQQPASPQGPDAKSLQAAVRRTVALKQREAELANREKELSPLRELQELAKSNPAAAFRKLTGDERLADAFKAVSQDVLGLQQEGKALESLPREVREQLAKLPELEKRAALAEELEKRLTALETGKQQAEEAFTARQRADAAERVYTVGYEAVTAKASELPLVAKHPKGGELVQAEWTAILSEKKAELAKVQGVERQKLAASLVLEAAQRVQAKLTEELGWLLPSEGKSRTLAGVKGNPGKGKPSQAPSKSTATSTPGQQRKPRTGTPGSLGEPTGTDARKLTHQQRLALLREKERAGTLYTRG